MKRLRGGAQVQKGQIRHIIRFTKGDCPLFKMWSIPPNIPKRLLLSLPDREVELMSNVKWMKGKENELKIGGGLKSRHGGEGFFVGRGGGVWGRAEKKIKATKCTVNLNRLNIRCAQQQKTESAK